jgi:hypothetical protein
MTMDMFGFEDRLMIMLFFIWLMLYMIWFAIRKKSDK